MRINRIAMLSGIMALLIISVGHAEPMRFALVGSGGNCEGCEWIAAEGEIIATTADLFHDFITREGAGYAGMVVQLNGSGHDMAAAIELGERIREHRFITSVGKTIPDAVFPTFSEVIPGDCREACAIAFLGGKDRHISDASQLTFYGFRPDDKPAVRAYFERLGLDTSLYNFLAVMAPDETYRPGTTDKQLGEMGIITPLVALPTKWALIDTEQGMMAASTLDTGADAVTVRFYCRAGIAALDYLVAINKFGEHLLAADELREVYQDVAPKIGYETTFMGVTEDTINGQMVITLALSASGAEAFAQSGALVADYAEVAHAYAPYYEWFDFGRIPGDQQALTTVIAHCD